MKKYLLLPALALLFLASSSQASILFSPKPVDLGFENIQQEGPNWCWAAIVQQVLTWRGQSNPPTQCQLVTEANRDRGETANNCCEAGDQLPAACDRPGNNLEVMTLVNRYGGRVDGVQMPDTPEQVHEYLAAGRALAVGLDTGETVGHVILIRGIVWENGEAMLLVNDPIVKQSIKTPFSSSRPSWKTTQTISRSL